MKAIYLIITLVLTTTSLSALAKKPNKAAQSLGVQLKTNFEFNPPNC